MKTNCSNLNKNTLTLQTNNSIRFQNKVKENIYQLLLSTQLNNPILPKVKSNVIPNQFPALLNKIQILNTSNLMNSN
jgi:hypothetical protein